MNPNKVKDQGMLYIPGLGMLKPKDVPDRWNWEVGSEEEGLEQLEDQQQSLIISQNNHNYGDEPIND